MGKANQRDKKKSISLSPTSRQDHITAYLMILPAFALLTIFVIIPLGMALYYSFTSWSFYKESAFVGLNNFRLMLKDPLFIKSVRNAVKFMLIILPLQIVLTFLFANALRGLKTRTANAVKTAIYVPTVISGVVASVIFLFLMDYRAGVINEILKSVGVSRIAFTRQPWSATIMVVLPSIWLAFGPTVIMMLAGLLNVPNEYYEAAQMDGAGKVAQMFFITIPAMRNIFVLQAIGIVTGSLQMFDIPFIMTGGGPVDSTLTPMMFLYNNFRAVDKNMSYTLAGALLMMVVIAAVSSIVFAVIRSEKSMDA